MHASASASGIEGPTYTRVFANGADGYPNVRIPALLTTAAGTLLAFAEGRRELGDHSQNQIICKRSADGGASWGPMEVVASDGENTLTDASVVVDRRTGRIVLHHTWFANGYHTDKAVPGYDDPHAMRNYVITSDDDGVTWSERLDVTRAVKEPDVIVSVVTCGVGIQLRRGKHKDRLVHAVYNSRPELVPASYVVFSDDGGATWPRGEVASYEGEDRTGEPQVVVLADGSVMMNARTKSKRRRVGVSADGGATFGRLAHDDTLIDPGCMGSILRYSDPLDGQESRILFCNAATGGDERFNGMVRLSYDEGKTWPVGKVIYAGPFAYSCIAVLPDGRIGVLYEQDEYEEIVLARFSLGWVTEGEDLG
ncbi:MAG: sialidase [Planctomycetaceae bacterium]|nr:sialidase [Planctomycetaceae bacterium]